MNNTHRSSAYPHNRKKPSRRRGRPNNRRRAGSRSPRRADQSDARSAGIFSQRTNQMREVEWLNG
eukprot:745553-Prorocentrum_minimum.AAC.1